MKKVLSKLAVLIFMMPLLFNCSSIAENYSERIISGCTVEVNVSQGSYLNVRDAPNGDKTGRRLGKGYTCSVYHIQNGYASIGSFVETCGGNRIFLCTGWVSVEYIFAVDSNHVNDYTDFTFKYYGGLLN